MMLQCQVAYATFEFSGLQDDEFCRLLLRNSGALDHGYKTLLYT